MYLTPDSNGEVFDGLEVGTKTLEGSFPRRIELTLV